MLVCGSSLLLNEAQVNYEGNDGIVLKPDNSQQVVYIHVHQVADNYLC